MIAIDSVLIRSYFGYRIFCGWLCVCAQCVAARYNAHCFVTPCISMLYVDAHVFWLCSFRVSCNFFFQFVEKEWMRNVCIDIYVLSILAIAAWFQLTVITIIMDEWILNEKNSHIMHNAHALYTHTISF